MNEGPNPSEIAKLMLLWEQRRAELDDIEQAIRDGVMQIGKTQTVGNVKAAYSGGRKSYSYDAAYMSARDACGDDDEKHALLDAVLEAHTTIVEKVDYRSICEALQVHQNNIPFTQSPPSVTIKLL